MFLRIFTEFFWIFITIIHTFLLHGILVRFHVIEGRLYMVLNNVKISSWLTIGNSYTEIEYLLLLKEAKGL